MPLAIQQALKFGSEQLPHSDTAELDAELLLLFCLNASRNILFTHPDQILSAQQEGQFNALLKRRQNGEPVAYLLGSQGFWDLDLSVAPHTLIPRGDTESLIDWVLEQSFTPNSILDLGTGTGALALALAREFPQSQVIGVDVVSEAVLLAKNNKALNKIKNVSFHQSDWFSALAREKFDLIISNPPYIDEDDIHLNEGDVRFEPASALVAKENGFADLFFIANSAQAYLQTGGCLLMEHGWQQAKQVQAHLIKQGYENVGSGLDLAGRERFTFGFTPK